ncbi:MAG: sulfite exporter TauE/SafE family protein [Gammaproteobacteria bacterium]|nr:sulfite exporter TauE/SafE family protein [Gammaproteobacteria bacterium]
MSQLFVELVANMPPLQEIAIFLVLGAVAGLTAGLFGVGGGLVIVPTLLWVFQGHGFDQSIMMHLAIGTSLATIIVTSLSSMHAHNKRKAVHWGLFLMLTPGIILGAWLGAVVADQLSTVWLQRVFAVFTMSVALHLVLELEFGSRRTIPGRAVMTLAGIVIGMISSIVGIGGGSMTVPFLHWNGVTIRNAVATSSACGLPIALAGTIGFVVAGLGEQGLPAGSSGYVYWSGMPWIVLTTIIFAPLGAGLAHSLPTRTLKRLFALLLFMVGIKLMQG